MNVEVLATAEDWLLPLAYAPAPWYIPMLWSTLNTGLDIATLGLIFRAMQHPGFHRCAPCGLWPASGHWRNPMLPGGVGALEATMVAIYVVLGVPGDVGLIVVLSFRVILFGFQLSLDSLRRHIWNAPVGRRGEEMPKPLLRFQISSGTGQVRNNLPRLSTISR